MKKRINLQFMMLALVAILATIIMSVNIFYGAFKQEVLQDLRMYTQLMVETGVWDNISGSMKDTGSQAGDAELRITIVDDNGNVIYDNGSYAEEMGNHRERPEIAEAMEKGEGSAIRQSETIGENSIYYAVRLSDGKVLRISKKVKSVNSLLASVIPVLAAECVILFFICILLSGLLTKSITKPIEQMAENLDNPASVKAYKELVPFVETIRKQHEDILRSANMRQEFTANVSHELKTPLTSISGYSELIESGMATDEDAVKFAAEIHKNSNRLLSLINDIIRLSELDRISEEDLFEDVDIYETAVNCVNMLDMSAKKNEVSIRIEGESAHISANRQMMEELIYNLCDNAIRYNNRGGTVDVIVREDNEKVVVEVKDTGIGIPKEHQERIFERFYRVDKSRSKMTGGTGLGLAIVKHIVAIHSNARLELESELGKGTIIRLLFTKAGK